MKKLTLCLLPLVGLLAACGDGAGSAPGFESPIQDPQSAGPNGEQTPLQPPKFVDNPGNPNNPDCDELCEDFEGASYNACVDACEEAL